MEVKREVILDLLPLYLAGEASTETEQMVKAYLAEDPDLAQLATQFKERLTAPPPTPVSHDAQALAFSEAKRKLALQTVGLAAVFTIGLIALLALLGVFFFIPA